MNQVKGETLAELEDAIIQVLKNARRTRRCGDASFGYRQGDRDI